MKGDEADMEELRRQNGLLRDELDGLASAMSHDLRDPLRAIVGYSGLLKRSVEGRLDEKESALLDEILTNAEQLNVYADALLQYSRLSRRKLNVINIFDMGRICGRAVDAATGERPEPSLDLKVGELPGARGDAALVEQVFGILLDNAIRFARKGRGSKAEIRGRLEEEMAVYTVADEGVGFPEGRAEDLFVLFSTLGEKGPENAAQGVGLALARRIVNRHGGWIQAEGSPGKGATITFALPALSEQI